MIRKIYTHENGKPGQTSTEDIWEQTRILRDEQKKALEKLDGSVNAGLRNITKTLLSTERNNVFSPCAVYLSLLALAGLCDGKSRKELLTAAFCHEDAERNRAEYLKRGVTADAELAACDFFTSLWIHDRLPLRLDVIRQQCEKHGSDVFAGEMGTEEMDSAIQTWVDTHTGKLLTQAANGIKTQPNTAMELLTASRFKADWTHSFWSGDTKKDRFYPDAQTEVLCDFMNGEERTQCMRGYQYTAVAKRMFLDYQMWFIRPNDEVTLKQLIGNRSVEGLLKNPSEMPLEERDVSMRIPKFDVTSGIDMKAALQTMGIKSVFDERSLPFSRISEDSRLFLGKADHTARVKITEDGVEAASYVDSGIAVAGIPERIKRMRFDLDRPFLFAVTKGNRIPLYVGAVVNPLEGKEQK